MRTLLKLVSGYILANNPSKTQVKASVRVEVIVSDQGYKVADGG